MSNVKYELNLKISAGTEEAVEEFSIDFLRSRGFSISPPNVKWEKLCEFMARVGIARHATVKHSIELFRERGGTVVLDKTVTGRIMGVMSNAAFDSFVTRNCVKQSNGQ